MQSTYKFKGEKVIGGQALKKGKVNIEFYAENTIVRKSTYLKRGIITESCSQHSVGNCMNLVNCINRNRRVEWVDIG